MLNASVSVQIKGDYLAAADLGEVKQEVSKRALLALSSGVVADQADLIFADQRTLAASGTEDIDLAGTLLDAFGAVINFAKIKAILITAAKANTNNVVVGGKGATGYVGPFGANTHTIAIPPGGVFLIAGPALAGLGAVGAGATDLLKILNSAAGTPVTYDIIIIGTSA